jgi:hypothetical protein
LYRSLLYLFSFQPSQAILDLDYEIGAAAVQQPSLEEVRQQRLQEKETRRAEKELKKAARAKRIAEIEESVRRRASKSVPKNKQG